MDVAYSIIFNERICILIQDIVRRTKLRNSTCYSLSLPFLRNHTNIIIFSYVDLYLIRSILELVWKPQICTIRENRTLEEPSCKVAENPFNN